jgi:hypothetical protein
MHTAATKTRCSTGRVSGWGVLALVLVTMLAADLGYAAGRGGGGGAGAGSRGGSGYHGYRGHGGHGAYYGSRGYYGHRAHSGYRHRYSVYFGGAYYWPWYSYPYYPYSYAPYYGAYYAPYPSYDPLHYDYAAPAQQRSYAWYYCPPLNAYYPYVSQCPTAWQPVQPYPPQGSGGLGQTAPAVDD